MSGRERVAEIMPESKKENRSSRIRKVDFAQQSGSPADRVLFLQRTIGNQGVERLIRSGALQAKLKIGQPDDIYEQEADRVAEQVMRMPEPNILEKKECARESINIQRKCPRLEEYEKMHRKPLYNFLQSQKGGTPEVTPELEANINSVNGGGQPLPESVRSFFEPRFGHDFNSVYVHADNRADRLSRSVNALAFTAGRNIFFSSGAYNPASRDGLHLLAHELTHTVQQTGGLKAKQFSHLPDIQMKCAACEEELQRSLDISSTSELIQRRVVCDEWGENCQSVPDEEETSHSQPEEVYTPADQDYGYTPADQNYTPADQNYTPADQNYIPADQNYTPADQNYTPADQNYTPAEYTASEPEGSTSTKPTCKTMGGEGVISEFFLGYYPDLRAQGYMFVGKEGHLDRWDNLSKCTFIYVQPREQEEEKREEPDWKVCDQEMIDGCVDTSDNQTKCNDCCDNVFQDFTCNGNCKGGCLKYAPPLSPIDEDLPPDEEFE